MTVNGSISGNVSLSLLQAAGGWTRTSSRDSSKQTDPLLAALEKSDPEKAKALKEQKAQINQLVGQLQSSKTDLNAQKKEAARQKIEQIKAQIKALRLQVAGDPKALARQAARLARELASAARDYAQGGGGGNLFLSSASGAAPAASTQTAQTAGTTTLSPDADAPNAAVSAASKAGQDAGTAADIQSAENQAREAAGKESRTDAGPGEDTKAKGDKIKDEVAAKIAETAKKTGESDADSKFAEETRRLLNQLKAIIKAAKDRLHAEKDEGGKGDIDAAERAFRDVEKSLGVITGGAATAISSGVNILA